MKNTSTSELRKHYFEDRYVVIAPKRNLRPNEIGAKNLPHTSETSASPSIEKDRGIFQINDAAGNWLVKVIDNKFPALSLDNPKAYGKQEVIIETPLHNIEFSQLPIMQIERIFKTYSDRLTKLRQLKGIRHVSVFKNDGPKAGASIAHAHSQVIALPIVPPHLAHEAAALNDYQNQYASCAYCDIITWERQQKQRVIYNHDGIFAYAPYASENPFEVWISPLRHISTFNELSTKELHSTAVILQKICSFLDSAKISFNFFLQESLVGYEHHFVLKVEPRQTVHAGLELSTGVIVNPVSPEQATIWYCKSFK